MNYVTYDVSGNLTGAYQQDLLPEHADKYIEVPAEQRGEWVRYRANAARTGLELVPPKAYDLPGEKAKLIRRIDAEVDGIYAAVIGNRGPEYEDAATEAQAFKNAGYPAGAIPPSVSSWATPKGWTAQQAADDILMEAAKLSAAKQAIRQNRLARKEEARNASTPAALATAAAQWDGFVAALRVQLGL